MYMEDEKIKQLKEIGEKIKETDPERLHIEADEILLEVLEKDGHQELVNIYRAMQLYFWYA